MIADDDNGPARNGILLRPETDTSDGNLTRSFVPRRIALCPTTIEIRGPKLNIQVEDCGNQAEIAKPGMAAVSKTAGLTASGVRISLSAPFSAPFPTHRSLRSPEIRIGFRIVF